MKIALFKIFGFVLSHRILSNYEPQVNSTQENVGELPEGAKMSFDNGYFSGPNL